jgi:hypothetical protein
MKQSKYPVGAEWEAKCKHTGNIGTIWLSEIRSTFEVWRWSVTNGRGDWSTSYAACKKEIPIEGKFKRVK